MSPTTAASLLSTTLFERCGSSWRCDVRPRSQDSVSLDSAGLRRPTASSIIAVIVVYFRRYEHIQSRSLRIIARCRFNEVSFVESRRRSCRMRGSVPSTIRSGIRRRFDFVCLGRSAFRGRLARTNRHPPKYDSGLLSHSGHLLSSIQGCVRCRFGHTCLTRSASVGAGRQTLVRPSMSTLTQRSCRTQHVVSSPIRGYFV